MSRAARKAQLWNILREHLAEDPALVQAVSELERFDEVSQVEALAMHGIARGFWDAFTLNGLGWTARMLLALRDA